MLEHNVTVTNPRSIESLLKSGLFTREYKRSQFQQQVVGPLRRDPRIFVGWSGGGLFLVTSPDAADAALAAYTGRIRAELRHARSLRKLARRTRLMDGHVVSMPR